MGTDVRRSEAVALLLLASAWGWNGGNFSQPNMDQPAQAFVTALHYLPVGLIVVLGGLMLVAPSPKWTRVALDAVVAIGAVALAVIVVIGISNPDPNSFGPHNFADYVPVFLIVLGIVTWFGSQLRHRPQA